MGEKKHLIIGVVLILIVVVTDGMRLMSGTTLTTRGIILDASLIAFAISRFVLFRMPLSPLVKPLRMLGIGCLLVYFVMKYSH